MRRTLLLAALAFLTPAITDAQRSAEEPKRPVGPGIVDTNDARAYYDHGLMVLKKDPKTAANAFYWAARLDPNNADAFYGRRVALLLTDMFRLGKYWRGDRNTLRKADIKAIDSLYFHSLTLNPFFYEKLERVLQDAIIEDIIRQSSPSGAGAGEMAYYINQYLNQAGWGERAFRAYGSGDFKEALEFYANAIKGARYKHYYRMMRGRLFFQIGFPDSALTELKLAVEEMRKRDQKDMVYVYESKALVEHSIGMAHERLGEKAAAKEAYARALQEDLAYSAAHTRLGYMAIESSDTTAALSEFDLAVQLRPEDSGLRFQYGFLLAEAGKHADAEEQLKKALAANPWYAAPHHTLGTLYQRQNKSAEALASFKTFLSLASKYDTRRLDAERRVAALSGQ
jgi:predicted negative regulator of RcsB-dependent stress response